MLAWLRTSLALVAGGVAVETFAVTLEPKWLPGAIGVFAISIGAILAIVGYVHWIRTTNAMKRGESLPAQHAAPIVTVGILIVAVGLVIGIFI
jgi:putative membrane protein